MVMQYDELIEQLSPEVIAQFREALELGRWPDGRSVSPEQREHCMQAVIAFEHRHVAAADRVGYIDKGRKADQQNDNDISKLQWKDPQGQESETP
jgi:uncharacterized protein YeaC (DUF1315 family)